MGDFCCFWFFDVLFLCMRACVCVCVCVRGARGKFVAPEKLENLF